MQSLTALLEWLQASSLAVFIHQRAWAFTTIELVHVAAISLVIGTIAIVDLRLLGFASAKRPFTELARAPVALRCLVVGMFIRLADALKRSTAGLSWESEYSSCS